MILSNSKIDYSSTRRVPTVKLGAQIQGTNNTTTTTMPASTSLQDINSHTHKFNWNKDQPLINLSESLLTSKTNVNNRHKAFSQSDDRIFEHPEVTIKPTRVDDRVSRRSLITNKITTNHEINGGGSVPNILEHPDMKTPIVMGTQQVSLSSSSSSSTSSSSHHSNRKIMRQQSADVYSTLARTVSPANRDNHSLTNQMRTNSPGSLIDNIIERPEQEKSDDSSSFSPPPPATTTRAPVKIVREYSEVSSASDVDRTGKQHSNKTNKPQSEEDDFW